MRQTARYTSLPAPVGGLNARDALAAMDAKDAVILDNWFPYPNDVAVRKGYSDWCTGFASPVQSLMKYTNTSGVSSLFTASGTSFYDATTQGAVGAAAVAGLSNAQWQHNNVTTPGGSYLYCFNGVDSPQLYNGTVWQAVTAVSAPIAITGVTTSLLVQGSVFKNRLFMVEKNSMNIWYLPVQQVGGAAVKFDLSTIFQLGGYVMAQATWTIDAGSGMDDHCVFITSEGEVAVYRGTDPSASATWALVGVFRLGRPLGRKCFAKYGGDLMVLCAEGLFPLARGLLSSSINRQAAVTDKIQNAMSDAISTYFANYGWSVTVFSDANMLLVNVPAMNGANYQFVQNTITQAWTVFTGWNASSWEVMEDDIYFGDDTGVRKAWSGNLDGVSVISFDALPAFDEFGGMAQNKYFTMVRPYLSTDGNPSILYGLNIDYFAQDVSGTLSYTPPNPSMTWGSMVWGSMVWGGSLSNITGPHAVGAVGRSAAIRLAGQSNGANLRWAATDFVHQPGGFL
jgi:hypothetical protein